MVTMRISRSSGYSDLIRAYQVILDGKPIGELHNGETKEFSIAPGAHAISLKIDWCRSKELAFTATDGQPLSFRAGSNVTGWKLLINIWYITAARDEYLFIEQTAKHA